MSRSIVLALAGVAAVAVPLMVACAGSDPPAVAPSTPTPSTPLSSTPATAPAASSAAPAAPTLASILTTDPNAISQMATAAASAPAPTMRAPNSVKDDPVEAGIHAIAAKAAPGMQPDGMLATGTLAENSHMAMNVSLEPGKCYAIVGFSPKGEVQDLDLRLFSPPFFNLLAGEDTTDDAAPVIGRAPNAMCPILPVGLSYKLDIESDKGGGRIGIQLYSRAR